MHGTKCLSDNTREIRAKVRIGQISDLDGSFMDGSHYPRYLLMLSGIWSLATLGLARAD